MISSELFKTPSEQEYTNQKIEIQKDYAMRNFSKYIQENIIEFNRLLPDYTWINDTKKIDCLLWSKRA